MPHRVIGWILVVLQFALLAALVIAPHRQVHWLWAAIGGLVMIGGAVVGAYAFRALGSALTPTPLPRPDEVLRTDGPYRWVRHPIYSALLLLAWGWTIAVGGLLTVLIAAALSGLLLAKSRWEDRMLHAVHGRDWEVWAARTGALLPRR